MRAAQSRLEHIERRFGLDTKPCGVCGHRAGGNRCETPEAVAELNAKFDEVMREHMAMTEKWRSRLIELGEKP